MTIYLEQRCSGYIFIYTIMLKKKILGAKVLDTNGFVQATRLITPNNAGKNHQLGDIYSANAIDEKISQIEVGDNTDISELKVAIAENKTAISDEQIRAQQQETSINELVQLINQQLQHAIKGIKLNVTKYSDSGDEATLVLSRGRFDVNNDKPVTSTVKLDFSQMHQDFSDKIAAERESRHSLEEKANKLEKQIEALTDGLHITGEYNKDGNYLNLILWRPDVGDNVINDKAWKLDKYESGSFYDEVMVNEYQAGRTTATNHWVPESTSSINLSDIIDTNDLVSSDTDTITTKDGKTSIKTKTLSKDDVQKMIDDTVNKENNK